MLKPYYHEWSGTEQPKGLFAVDQSNEFYRLWSALQFVYCIPGRENELDNKELFGDGMLWAGFVFMYMLNQHLRYEVFDFSFHIMNIEEATVKKAANSPVAFCANAEKMKCIKNIVYSILRHYYPKADAVPEIFHPPTTLPTAAGPVVANIQ